MESDYLATILNVQRWFLVGLWTVFGIWSLCRPAGSSWIRDGFAKVQVADRARLDRALALRERLEGAPTWLGRALGILSLAAAAVAANNRVAIDLLVAVVTLASAAFLAAAYSRLRKARGPRAASLKARIRSSVVPRSLFATVTASVLCPLFFLDVSPFAATVTAAASLSIVVLAWMIAGLPALVRGDDVAVESFVDDRLRHQRVAAMLQLATTPSVFFFTLHLAAMYASPWRLSAFCFTAVASCVIPFLSGGFGPRGPSPDELRAWAGDAR
jgi:hypothetical protein